MADSDKNSQREGDATNVWHRSGPLWRIGDEEFKFVMPRGNGQRWNITPLVESASWEDIEPVMTGSLGLRWPDDRRLKIEPGDEVKCLVAQKGGGRFKKLWEMRILEPEYSAGDGGLSCSLENDLATLAKSKDDFRFVKGENKHKKGWLPHQIAKQVLEEYRIPAKLAKTHHRIARFEKRNTSPLDVINAVYKEEREHTGRRYVIFYRDGVLHIRPLRRNKFLALLKKQIIEALYSARRHKEFATVLTVRGSTDKAKSSDKREKKKLEVTVKAKNRIKRFGYIHQFENRDNADSRSELREVGKRQLKRRAKIKHTIEISHVGIPQVRRGDAVRVDLRRVPHFTKPRIVFVKQVLHNLSSGDYTMELTLSEDDPYRDARKERECLQKCKKAAEAGNEPPKECDCPGWIEFENESSTSEKNRQRA